MKVKTERALILAIGFLFMGLAWYLFTLLLRSANGAMGAGVTLGKQAAGVIESVLLFGSLLWCAGRIGLRFFSALGKGKPLPIDSFVDRGEAIVVIQPFDGYYAGKKLAVVIKDDSKKFRQAIVSVPLDWLPKGGLHRECSYALTKGGLVFRG